LARYIREDLRNLNVRIILRTGQPGQAPEEQVIKDYDINDYKEKTDLTRRKLITVFYAGLRAYRDLMRIENARLGLRRSIEAIGQVYDSQNLRSFASAVLEQVNHLLDLKAEGLCASRMAAYAANACNGHIKVLAATQAYSQLLVDEEVANLPAPVQTALTRTLQSKQSHYGDRYYAGYFRTKAGSESMVYMAFQEPISDAARELLEVFACNVAVTYDGLLLREETETACRATISIMGDAIERRNAESALHVQQVGDVAQLLALQSGFTERDAAILGVAASLHDVGKVHIPVELLTKADTLSDGEWVTIKTHCELGRDMLAASKLRVHQIAARVALEHHERWDGGGYPQGLSGQAISVEGRIAAVADVLVSLLGESSYKRPWTKAQAFQYLSDQAGSQFEPGLIGLLVANRGAVEKILAPAA
jgi:response regulator RpfG family c-di-GMP phosphodiesterase